jgi:hypothetical protein
MSETASLHDYNVFTDPNWLLPSEEGRMNFGARNPRSDILWHPEKFVPAKLEDYAVWFRGFLQTGGEATGVQDPYYAERRIADAVVAAVPFRLDGETGTDSRDIFVLPGVELTGGDSGHCDVYLFDGYRQVTRYHDRLESSAFLHAPIVATPEFGRIPGVGSEFRRLMRQAIHSAQSDECESASVSEVTDEYLGRADALGLAVSEREIRHMILGQIK